jgi:hypothetical protein
LEDWGYALAIRPLALINPVVSTLTRSLNDLAAPRPLDPEIRNPGDLFEAVNLSAWLEVGQRFETN